MVSRMNIKLTNDAGQSVMFLSAPDGGLDIIFDGPTEVTLGQFHVGIDERGKFVDFMGVL